MGFQKGATLSPEASEVVFSGSLAISGECGITRELTAAGGFKDPTKIGHGLGFGVLRGLLREYLSTSKDCLQGFLGLQDSRYSKIAQRLLEEETLQLTLGAVFFMYWFLAWLDVRSNFNFWECPGSTHTKRSSVLDLVASYVKPRHRRHYD